MCAGACRTVRARLLAPQARAHADLVVFDLDAIRETATWTQPGQLATGVRDVWINGQRVVAGGSLAEKRPGRVLRHETT